MSKTNKQSQAGNLILILVAMVLGVLIGLMFASRPVQQPLTSLQGKVDEVLGIVENRYVDDIDADSLSERLLSVLLNELDPHSTYLSARETEKSEEMMRGSFDGVGLMLHREGDTTYIGQVLADGPSVGLGMLPGDMIVAVGGEQVSGVGMPADSVVARLRGPKGSKVVVEVQHVDGKNNKYTVRRGMVPHHTLPYYTMLSDTIGYIHLTSFATTSHEEFRDAVLHLKRQGMRHLVFDLRSNGGGSLQAAVGIAGELLPTGSLIVYTKGAHSRRNNIYSLPGGSFTSGGVTVMVDENSASASEVVSGALQDNDRATIVGRRTFGKGLVQGEYQLSDGSSVLLTTARYYTPSGRCIQRSYADGTEEYYRDYFNQLMDEAYADTMVMAINDSTPYRTVGGRTVYGGGGIAPDVPIPYRKDSSLVYYNRLSSKGLLSRVAFDYVKKHAEGLMEKYPDAEAFKKGFKVDESMIQRLATEGEKAGVKRNEKSLNKQRGYISAILKANIGMALYGDRGFYDSYIPYDDDLNRVVAMLKQKKI